LKKTYWLAEINDELDSFYKLFHRWFDYGVEPISSDWLPTDKQLLHLPFELIVPNDPLVSFQEGTPTFKSGKIGRAADFDGKRYVEVGDYGNFGFQDTF